MPALRQFLARGAMAAAIVVAFAASPATAANKTVRVALGDIASVENLNLLIALEHMKERGIDVELTSFNDEDIAIQAVVNGQADVGLGVPYAVIQKGQVPLRIFYQLASLQFYPVVANDFADWKALNGQGIAVQGRGSGSEAVARMMEQKEGIKFGEISYVPGSEVRAVALMKGNIKATLLDLANKNLVMQQAPGKFHVLPVGDTPATDEALFARQDWLEQNADVAQTMVEELLKTTRAINADPTYASAERKRLELLPDLEADLEKEIDPYFKDSVEAKIFPNEGGGTESVQADFDFYSASGALEGDKGSLKSEDFWDLGPLEKARQAVGS